MNEQQTQKRPRTRVWFKKRKAKRLSDQESTTIRTINDFSFLEMINLALDKNYSEYCAKKLGDYKAVVETLAELKKDEGNYYELRCTEEWVRYGRRCHRKESKTLYHCYLDKNDWGRITLDPVEQKSASNGELSNFAKYEKKEKSGEYDLTHYF